MGQRVRQSGTRRLAEPEEILDAMHLQRTSLVADIGAGTGYFSVRIAKRIPEGKIFAADIEPDMVRYLGAEVGHFCGDYLCYPGEGVARSW
jgi:ubiquinone/menaquinone biosynthesis C-methylase UbiE